MKGEGGELSDLVTEQASDLAIIADAVTAHNKKYPELQVTIVNNPDAARMPVTVEGSEWVHPIEGITIERTDGGSRIVLLSEGRGSGIRCSWCDCMGEHACPGYAAERKTV